MDQPTSLVWLRNDLRLSDNPALFAARKSGDRVVALYIHETDEDVRAPGGAARWWLNRSLESLGQALGTLGISLLVRSGKAATVLDQAIAAEGVQSVHWNRRYAPGEREVDQEIKTGLRERGLNASSYAGNLLAEPWTIATGQGKPYSVFSPYWKTLKDCRIEQPLPAPEKLDGAVAAKSYDSDYRAPKWSEKFEGQWTIGESAAQQALHDFLDERLEDYPEGRDFPGRDVTSRLSPHLRFGEITARQVWYATLARIELEPEVKPYADKFLSELAWRDFSYHQLYHRSDIATVPMQEKYTAMRWSQADQAEAAWQQGQTGIPIIDAGMRELWQTGYMHNRVRMLVASLLTKNLLIDWRRGERWFWDCLVDGDVANNPASWQWVAGCGLDAAPYFRIFNPVTQGERFDEAGDYVRKWVPELKALPDKWIHDPASAPESILREASITIGKTYPLPIVDLKASRQRALERQGEL
ncbi:deoxyribodipyrimidine photolyase [Devosia sp. Root685]|uniref:cryptochrome/photolyase family protein n=1 Tax=Devosia sp. Root685 TaxID=1736587 RepID=UPI000701FC76|nr:deoxyribodipyrimidine photo-lyase [Devosia sp. Root685]KRA99837.1 deoxyribodipyrimidine photolyase [Devosia sp. Root685]